ncbi:MAG: hypothetical protein ACJ8AI_08650 [Rhodopila sp.]
MSDWYTYPVERTSGTLPVRKHLRPAASTLKEAIVYDRDEAGRLFCQPWPLHVAETVRIGGEA